MNVLNRVVFFLATALMAAGANAQDAAPVDPELAQMQAETARLTQQVQLLTQESALAKARFGAAPTAPAGTIATPEKFVALGYWTAGAASRRLAQQAVAFLQSADKKCVFGKDIPLLITSVADRRTVEAAASLLNSRLISFTKELNRVSAGGGGGARASRAFAIAPVAAAISGTVGTLESLVSLFRSDYSISEVPVTLDKMALRLEVAEALQAAEWDGKDMAITVDGLQGARSDTPALLASYSVFDAARISAGARYAAATHGLTGDALKPFVDEKAILDAAAAFDQKLTTPVDGSIPLVNAALQFELSGKNQCVLYVDIPSYGTSIMTRKRLLSKNDSVTAVAGGMAQLVLFDEKGAMVKMKSFRIDQRVGGKLSDVLKTAGKLSELQD